MKSQIQNNNSNNNNKKNVGIVELLTPIFFQKFSREVTKTFLGKKKLWGGCSKLEDHVKVWEEFHK